MPLLQLVLVVATLARSLKGMLQLTYDQRSYCNSQIPLLFIATTRTVAILVVATPTFYSSSSINALVICPTQVFHDKRLLRKVGDQLRRTTCELPLIWMPLVLFKLWGCFQEPTWVFLCDSAFFVFAMILTFSIRTWCLVFIECYASVEVCNHSFFMFT